MSTDRPEISIVIPVYNGEKYITRCLESVIRMNYSDWECIVVDDGSTDSSWEMMNKFHQMDSRIRVLHKNNGGVSSARNEAIRKAAGKWISFVDVDDLVSTDYCDSLHDGFAEKADIVILQIRRNDGPDIASYASFGLIENPGDVKRFIDEKMRDDICRCLFGKIFRSELISANHLSFNESLPYGEDTVFNLQAFVCCKSIFCASVGTYSFFTPERLYPEKKYRITQESLMLFQREFGKYYLERGFRNLSYERLMFRNFRMLEQITPNKKGTDRKLFYKDPVQIELRQRTLNSFALRQRLVYYFCENTPDGAVWQFVRKLMTQY